MREGNIVAKKKLNLDPYKNAIKYMAAVNDPTGLYRYSLLRKWGNSKRLLFILLNPSTATAEVDDPTIERCIDFAIKWEYNNLEVVNLFAFRTKNPNDLYKKTGPIVGPKNDYYIKKAIKRADKIILAWGNHGDLHNRGKIVLKLIQNEINNKEVNCLKITARNHPQHPLYINSMVKPIVYPISDKLPYL